MASVATVNTFRSAYCDEALVNHASQYQSVTVVLYFFALQVGNHIRNLGLLGIGFSVNCCDLICRADLELKT